MKNLNKKTRQPFLNGLPQVDFPKNRRDNIEHVRSWLDFQPHLPGLTDEHLHLYLHACYDNLEKTKQMIESCYTFKTLTPELFSNRDLLEQGFQGILDICELVLLPQPSPEGYDVVLFRFTSYDSSRFVFLDGLRALFVAVDFYLSEYRLGKGLVIVFDIKGLSFAHLAKAYPISMIKKAFFFVQECMPLRLKGIHIVNTGTIIEKLMALIKPFINNELGEMIHIHATVDSLTEQLPMDVLPEEYGGKAGSATDIYNDLKNTLLTQYVDWFIEEEGLRTDESKRVGKSTVKDTLFGVEGSFRKLDID